MTTLLPPETSSDELLLVVSLQKTYWEPPRVTALALPMSRCRAPQLPIVPSAFLPFQQARALLPETALTGSWPKSRLLLLVRGTLTGGRLMSSWPTSVVGF